MFSTSNEKNPVFLKGNIIPAICITIMANITNRPDLVVTLLIIGIAMSGFQYGSGFLVNAVDIAPRHAGIILAMSNTVASLCGFLAPFAVGLITESVSKTGSFSNCKCVTIFRIQICSHSVITR